MQRICTVYRSSKVEGMYLYVDKQQDLAPVPPALLQRFGTPQRALTLVLNPQRKLARVDVNKVLQQLDEQGYFLQMPPGVESEMQALAQKNSRLSL